jgi:DNA-binding MarR family transcriptional regulator
MENLSESTKVAKLFQEVMFLYRHRMSKVIEDTGITAPQFMVMGLLGKEKCLKITELSNKIGLSNSTVSGIVDRLEKQGMVIRKRSEEDRRVVYVSAAPNFNEMNQSFHKQIEEIIETTINQGTKEELDKIHEGLITLKRLLGGRQD